VPCRFEWTIVVSTDWPLRKRVALSRYGQIGSARPVFTRNSGDGLHPVSDAVARRHKDNPLEITGDWAQAEREIQAEGTGK
jgi:hypothetical protein